MAWLCIPSTCSPGAAAESLAICASDIRRFARSRSNLTPRRFCCNDRLTAFFRSFPFGTTLEPSGGTIRTSSRFSTRRRKSRTGSSSAAVSPVKTYPPPEPAKASKARGADYGASSRGSLASYDPATCSWRTRHCSLLEDLEPSLETFPNWGMMRTGACWEHVTADSTIIDIGCGLPDGVEAIPTPLASDCIKIGCGVNRATMEKNLEKDSTHQVTMAVYLVALKRWPRLLVPDAIEWMMGWPVGWTFISDSESSASETDKFRMSSNSLGKRLCPPEFSGVGQQGTLL